MKEMEEALLKRHPDSLSNLIRAAGPSEEELNERKRLLKELSDLKDTVELKEAEMVSSMYITICCY